MQGAHIPPRPLAAQHMPREPRECCLLSRKAPHGVLGMTDDAGVELSCQKSNLNGDSCWETV